MSITHEENQAIIKNMRARGVVNYKDGTPEEIAAVERHRAARKRNNQKWVDDRFETIYLGHSQIQYLMSEEVHQGKPQRMCNVFAMDTGAAYTGKVSMMDIDTKMLYQSDYVCKYYPDHKGRNVASYNEHLRNGGEPR